MKRDMNVYSKFTDMFKNLIKGTDVLRNIVLLLTLMTLGVTSAWAQTFEPGFYFIASRDYKPANTTTNFYLCPTENWYYYQSSDPYYTNTADPDNVMPFMTTYQCRNGVYDALNAIWSIEKIGETNYYYIKHVSDGKYLTYNVAMGDNSNAGRMRIHLEASPSDDDAAQFQINWVAAKSCYEITTKKSGPENNRKYLNPSGPSGKTGNINSLVGTNARTDGPSGCPNIGGIIGLWTAGPSGDTNSSWYFEDASSFVCETPTITYNESTQEVSISTATDGATIYYTTDGATPTSSSTPYTAAFTVSATTNIQAIAVKAGMINSVVGSKKVVKYVYNILNRAGNVAIQYTIPYPVSVGGALSGYDDIPEEIRSPYIYGEEIKFYNNADHADEHEIGERPSTDNIYVTYTTGNLGEKFLHLRGARALNVMLNGEYIYDSGTAGTGTFAHEASPTEDDKSLKKYLWYFSGEDPYAVEIKNANTNNYIGYTTPSTLSLETSPTNKKFILMSGSANDTGNPRTYEQLEFMAATGDGNYYRIGRTGDNFNISTTATGDASLQIKAYPNSSSATYKLIDQAGKVLLTKTSKLEDVTIPTEWVSPLVTTYNYWKVGAFDTYDGETTYKLKDNPEPYRITTPTDVDGDIFITYEVSNTITFDISDDDKAHNGSYPTYMLKFYGGQTFKQENGTDGIETTVQKAEYPYSNGDAKLYVYSDTKRANQFASGASTRPRWLWYPVCPKAATVKVNAEDVQVTPGYKGDPYHVKIMSHSADVKSKDDPDNTKHQNYFRTYVVNYGGSNHVVTGLTTKHEDVSGADPTEYMILGAPNNRYKLVTLNEIPLDINGDGDYDDEGEGTERRTVNTFEQYWKNNPTVQNILINKVTAQESADDGGIALTSDQVSQLPNNWHTYQTWAQAAPWVSWSGGGSGKQYHNKHHWFQTIDMGSTGEFTFEATTLDPQVILLDQHGWEIMRAPLSDAATLRKYDSPMVETYHWYPTAAKVTGYHKYKVSDPEIIVYRSYIDGTKTKWTDSGNRYTHTSTSLADSPYDHFTEHGWEAQDKSVKTDFYVTYDVSPAYARLYVGAATENDVTVSAFWVKQGTEYAKNESNTLTATTADPTTLPSTEEVEWYVKPNFNIDTEMGYQYDVEEDDGAGGTFTPNKAQKDALNYAEGRNGFDPYNVQFQSVKNTYYYFKVTTTDKSELTGGTWTGYSTDLSLKNMSDGKQETVNGYEHAKLSITNATFMVVKDASGHMLLMPRFDHTKVVNSFSAPRLSDVDAAEHTTLELIMAPKVIHHSGEFAALNGQYTLASDFKFKDDFMSLGTAEYPFTGSIDGGLHTLTGLSMPLIAYAENAIVKNIILDDVTIGNAEDVPNVGAIAANTSGDTRIYNCGILSGSVGGGNTDDVGGIVGSLDGSARVINCYSYANITGGNNVGGIVGNNKVTTTAANIKTMVMNCMFYGDITGGSTKSPVYGGTNISNVHGGLNTFNYYSYEQLPTEHITDGKYNSALAIADKYLNRFEFYRLLLNSNSKLAAYYATSSTRTVKAEEMMKWVLETADRSIANPKPYPVLKAQGEYPSIINYDTRDLANYSEEHRNEGLKTGELTVNISIGSGYPDGAEIKAGKSQITLTRTDKDFDRFNFNYDKVQLPYYNDVGTKNYTGDKVVTGWKITAITSVAGDPYTSANYNYTKSYSSEASYFDYPNYNFADRKSSNKDLYSVSGRVFSQGAYFDVPYGVSSITIEPYWGNAVYVADKYYDVVYNAGYTRQDVTQLGIQVDASTTFNGQSVKPIYYKDNNDKKYISDYVSSFSGTVYDNAIVLVGNVHHNVIPASGDKPFTIMSVDEDNDHEPDYSMIYHHSGRTVICPIRFDFLNIPGTCQAQKPNNVGNILNFTIFKTKGWFETTNTCLVYSNQVEYDNPDNVGTKANAPLILLGGDFEQFVSTQKNAPTGKTLYIHVGSNVYIKSFGLGTHGDGSNATPHIPVSVTGGEFEGFYLTGTYNPNAGVKTDNAECYISGGHFVEAAGACQEQINGNVQWQIYDADIDAFFGGGINDAKPIKGTITTDIYNSHVGTFCGGPKFGNMTSGKAVTTNAVGCVFDEYFGAGYGGLSYSKVKYSDEKTYNFSSTPYQTERGIYYTGTGAGTSYAKKGPGVATDFDYEFFVWSTGETGSRKYIKFASFSLAECDNVSSTLTGCTINGNYYGGGSLGKVMGTATSVLDGCTVNGSVFGGGFSANIPKVAVRNEGTGLSKVPSYNANTGMFEPGEFSGTTDYEWKHVDNLPKDGGAGFVTEDGKNYVITKADLTTLGQVAYTDLTVRNNCSITGGVYGGGDESAVNQNTLVKIENVKTSGDTQNTISNVYGGGNTADVLGNTEVNMTSGTVSQDIYGGGRGETTAVSGDVTVNIGAKDGGGVLSGTGIVEGDVYGGSAFGDVNATKEEGYDYEVDPNAHIGATTGKATTVNIYGGTVQGSVFGGGRGDLSGLGEGHANIDARNFGPASVIMEGGTVSTAVYGGANVNGVIKSDATVTITGGTVGTAPGEGDPIANAVFGGGLGQPTLVNGNILVNIGTSGQTGDGATINGHVYGGGALGSVNASKPASDLVFDATKTTTVNLLKGTIIGDAYGGGLGQKNGVNGATSDVEAYVGGDVTVELNNGVPDTEKGCVIGGSIFGCNNQNGSPKGSVTVHIYKTQHKNSNRITNPEKANPSDPDPTEKVKGRYDVAAVYGGGNEAAYDPTDRAGGKTVVVIEGCDQTSINYVYGGGNAAAVPATEVTVMSSYEIGYLFGGGNGSNSLKPGADVGIIDLAAYKLNPANGTYGTGKAVTKLEGGTINYVYGGSNTNGNVRGGTHVEKRASSGCPLVVKEIYGAGQVAPMDGTVYIYLECMPDDFVDQVFGGAKDAVVDGGVTLTVTSGKFGRVFGGNDTGGSINGPITVRVKEEGCKELEIGELFGGGNMAPYSKYGYVKNESTGKWEPNEEIPENMKINFLPTELYPYPVRVFVESCTSIGSIFGGGLGSSATVTGDTYVNVNMMYGSVENIETHVTTQKTSLGHIGQIFGGGKEANVKGSTRIDVGTEAGSEPYGVIITPTIGEKASEDYNKTKYISWEDGEDISMSASEAGIYGGGKNADVIGNTTLNIGTKETTELSLGTNITGNIYGGGQGKDTHVTGSVAVNIGKKVDGVGGDPDTFVGNATITGDVYGGSALGTVNSSDNTNATESATTDVTLNYGAITGSIYGGGLGDAQNGADVFGPVTVKVYDGTISNSVYGCNNNNGTPKGTVTVNINGGTVNHSVYGGGNQAAYTPTESSINYPAVNIINGTVRENVFGGGLGLTATVTANPHVTIGDNVEGHTATILKSVYGGGELAGVAGNTNVVVNSGTIGTEGQGSAIYGNIYGGGFGSEDTSEMTEAQAVKEAGIIKGNTTITVNGGTVLHNIYGGGANGSVGTFTYNDNNVITGYTSGGLATINILGGTIGTNGHENGMIFGSSRGDVGAPDAIQDKLAWVYDTQVVIGTSGEGHGTDAPEPQVKGSVYGGGENGHTYRNTSVTIHSGRVGITDISIDGGAAYGYRGNVYGGGCGTDKYWIDENSNDTKDPGEEHYNPKSGIVNGTTTVVINGGHVVRNLYGAGAMGSAVVGTDVTINGGTIGAEGMGGGYVYAAARGDEALTDANQAYVGSTSLTIDGGTIWSSAFGGGQSGIVKGNVAVTVSGGVVKSDVYGGGALANTNTDNWNAATNDWNDTRTGEYYAEVKHLKKDESSVDGYYTRSGASEPYTYTSASGKADGTSKYYKKFDAFSTVAANGTAKTTTVSLTGGTIGNAYGGGLGQLAKSAVYYTAEDAEVIAGTKNVGDVKTPAVTAVEAMVYGDISLIVDGTKFTQETERVDGKAIPVTGRVFGCNNLNGTPKGSVLVWVKQTKRLDDGAHVKNLFEIQGVYGGGNMSDYAPKTYDIDTEFGQHTRVIIDGCENTSIERVYGGGNASNVPFTDVTIEGAFQIGYVFGGGNGGDKINKGTGAGWEVNPGANVTYYTNVVLHGGTIGEAFGGSDSKGTVGGTELTKDAKGICPLTTNNIYGASKEAETDNDVILNLAGCENSVVDKVFGGSYNADVRGHVTINIFSGIYTSVFGGNDRKGTIGGNITINVEEVDECNPIIIQNLYGGGSQADYPGVDDDGTKAKAYKGESYPRGYKDNPGSYEDFTSGNITINVKAATRIDRIFGGCDNATTTGNTTVNINMVKGSKAGDEYALPAGYTGNPIPNIVGGRIKDEIGTIGYVYGGGNEGDVVGNSIVNIGTEKDIVFTNTPEHLPIHLTPNEGGKYDVLGAHIDGDIYGGGSNGSVTLNTYVNICAKESATPGTYEAVDEGTDKVTIGGNVYGGGKGIADSFTCEKAMVGVDKENTGAAYVNKGTNVHIGHGTITGSVYGGGEIGRVEFDTKVTIGFGDGTGVADSESPVIEGEVYGAGQGVPTHGYSGLVRGNSTVTIQGDSWVKQNVYGAGKLASLGRYNIAKTDDEATAHGVEKGMPYELLSGGQSTVTIQGHTKIGPAEAMTMPIFSGNVFGAGKGILPYDVSGEPGRYFVDNSGNYTWESYAADNKEDAYLKYVETLGITHNAIVTIGGDAFVKGSVYGGSENGTIFAGTIVNIAGGQIGCGEGKTAAYTSSQWTGENPSDFTECAHWPYESPYAPYDKYAQNNGKYENGKSAEGGLPATGSAGQRASDGHTFYGNVFGGGCGKDPYKPGKWHRKGGFVGGNTVVNITGGHILTSVYGGNEMTDVGTNDITPVAGKGKCTINMTGGTLGVPRTDEQMKAHPVTCYLFGAGKGDQRIFFNRWTNVRETEVNITGTARIFGSAFGGGEDGHVLENSAVNIGNVTIGSTPYDGANVKIGTTGTSYVDGNVFGGGRGFSGVALTAGSTGGNVTVNISDGTMLGSIYGGGRLASVGIGFTTADDHSYGQLIDETGTLGDPTYGHIIMNISGGTIGTTTAGDDDPHPVGGNVFGGSMGRITLLDGSLNPLWPKQAVVKLSNITISGGDIKNNVYGGSEYGIVRNQATVNMTGGTVRGNVFGGGYGSDDQRKTTITAGGYESIPTVHYTFTPMQWTGCVSGNTFVNISGGTVGRNVYGGGDMASVGLINYNSSEDGETYNYITKHESVTDGFGLSWPYKFEFIAAAPGDPANISGGAAGGKATVNITGTAVVGTYDGSGKIVSGGYVYGGSKGKVWFGETKETEEDITEQRYKEAFMANVKETEVTIGTDGGSDDPHIRTVYGGAEDGHVYDDASVTIYNGTIANSVFGGGKGENKFKAKLWDTSTGNRKEDPEDVYSWTAGKVYGNTSVTMNGGSVGYFIYGGGNMASVGKGNYSGGADDYYPAGYGETLTGNLWTSASEGDNAWQFLNSGKTTVTIMGGIVGLGGYDSDGIPYGSVFGGSRGKAAKTITQSPRYKYGPDFYLGYVNKAVINIGGYIENSVTTLAADDGPTINGSIYGGGQDGHVRNSTEVKIFKGSLPGQGDYRSGNVFGAGSGIGKYTDGVNSYCNNASGSVTCTTQVDVKGGTISGSVYGGGALASVGPPKIPPTRPDNEQKEASDSHKSYSHNIVNIEGGTITGSVYGASRGPGAAMFTNGSFSGVSTASDATADKYNPTTYATSIWTEVNILGGTIGNNVYGGGEMGQTKESTLVNLKGGSITHDAYGGGMGTVGTNAIEANVDGNTTVVLNDNNNGGDADGSKPGCSVQKIYGCNNINGTPKGHALVHVYATQRAGTDKIVPTGGKHKKFDKLANYTISNYSTYTYEGKKLADLATDAGINTSAAPYTTYMSTLASGTSEEKTTALANLIELIASEHYDVQAVYGGGNLAIYEPTSAEENTEVIIDGCDLTSIRQVYGGGNAASAADTKVRINAAYEIHEVFGGGNGKDSYELDGKWYENPGANVGYYATYHHVTSDPAKGTRENPYPAVENDGSDGYKNAKTKEARLANYPYGKGSTRVEVAGGRIHKSYGGSNIRGNIRYEVNSAYEESGSCPMLIDETFGAGNEAITDADIRTEMECVDHMTEVYGGSTSGDVNSNIILNVTNGTFDNVFGGNKIVGRIFGSITVNVREEGCKPIIIGNLYAGGNEADYSIYGYKDVTAGSARSKAEYDVLSDGDKAAITVQKDPHVNIISATRINNVYGGGFKARVVGNPYVNVNMEEGTLLAKYIAQHGEYLTTDQTETRITGTTVTWRCRQGEAVGTSYTGILPIGTIGNVYGGGDQANVDGNTSIEIGTGKQRNDEGVEEVITPARNAAFIQERVYGGGNLGDVSGNATIEMGNGYVADRIYGGGKEGHIGNITTRNAAGKPTAFAENTGKTTVTISGGRVGPFEYSHLTGEEARAKVTPKAMTMQGTGADGVAGPDDYGYVFGGGRGELVNPATDPDINNKTYVNETEVTIKNGYVAGHDGEAEFITRPLIAGGVYGGSENGRVLHDTRVNIQGGQVGIGAGITEAFNNGTRTSEAYAEADFIDPTTATAEQIAEKAALLPECASWAYESPWLPYDEHAGDTNYPASTYGPASTIGSDGHTFYGNVFGGGSGYFAYETATEGVYEWLPSAGLVEGNTYVNISGGHILTSVYGGNEMTNVTGTAHVTMTGGTLGVPRTLAQIAAHPVTCYLFGAGKGDERVHFNKSTNVGHANVTVSGGIIYGSVFGGGEDGHVLGDVTMNIQNTVDNTNPENPVVTSSPKIGTWGTSYVDGNVFGGGRGFSGGAYTAGNVAGAVTMNITGGTMLGSIYGGGRLGSVGYGLFSKNEAGYGTMRADNVTEDGFTPPGGLTKGRGHVTVNISGDNTVIGNKYEYQYISPETTGDALATAKTYLPSTQFESNNRLKHTRGGNVFAGGMGRYTKLDGTSPISTYDGSGNLTSPIEWKKLGNVKSTKLTISGNPWIMGNVYGGGEFGAVQGYHTTEGKNYSTEILFSGGTVGTEITTADPQKETIETTDTRSIVQYTFGSIYGGGMGLETPDATGSHGGNVKDSTYISMSKPGESVSLVRASVYGGGEMAIVEGNTRVNISGGEIGRNEVKPLSDDDAGYVLFGGATMGNVYGGGKGVLGRTEAGQVKGNTNINISGGNVYHMVYGGGALGSVGTFSLSNGTDAPAYIPFAGVPYNWTEGTGTATVNITGGTIGISGRDNGLVFGSSRGNLKKPEDVGGGYMTDPYDRLAWVNKSVVKIGKARSEFDTDEAYNTYMASNTPQIKCSVYGGGENGHNNESATVNVYSGTIGITDTEDPWYNFGTNETVRAKAQLNRGNVYGAGSGSDTYTGDDGKEHYNPKSGMVAGNTFVNIAGGHIGRSVYGGGAMASVGTITNYATLETTDKHSSETNSFALSWPYKFVFDTEKENGKATVNVTGGHIGTRDIDGGDVYGSSRGAAGDRYETAQLAYTRETEVNITYPTTIDMTSEAAIQNDFTKQCITGSVHGSGENGYVYGDAKVTLNEGLIGHSLYGAGKGNGTYSMNLNKIGSTTETYPAQIYSLIAGKVMGNTYVTMNGGHVGRNVYGGGNMGSVGKGNYASGNDDYAYDSEIGKAQGYGEKIDGDLWTKDPATNTDAWYFQNSGKATVKVFGGIVGYIDEEDPTKSTKGQLPYGNVFGGSAGEAAPNVADNPSNLYLYSPAFFSGYVNETDVTIGGGYRCTTACTISGKAYKVGDSVTADEYNAFTDGKSNWTAITPPTIYASVYGGGQDGHVRRDTKVTVLGGEIGVPYTSDNQTLLQTDNLDSPQWLHRGNIYGGGSGITKYKFDFDGDGKTDKNDGSLSYNGKPFNEEDYSTSSGSVTRFTEVNVKGGTIHRNVYGGGSMGSIGAPNMGQTYDLYKPGQANIDGKPVNGPGRQSINTVNIGGGTSVVTIGTPFNVDRGWTYDKTYGGEVYGACRGLSTLDADQFSTSIWTQVNIKDKATIMGNVYGGGDNGKVKKDAEVKIGDQ